MSEQRFEILSREIAEIQTIDSLLRQILEDRQASEARKLLRQIDEEMAGDIAGSSELFGLYSAMLASLNEDDFRWSGTAFQDRRQLRRARLAEYERFRELFQLEVKLTRKLKRSSMALSSDWAGLEQYLRGFAAMWKASWMLRLAGWWFRLGIPGARDLCDAAAFSLFADSYFAACRVQAN